MTKQDFFKKNDEILLPLGFKHDLEDPQFHYYKPILTKSARKEFLEHNLPQDEPQLLIGNTGLNKGICLFTGANFIWLGVDKVEQAIEWASIILSIEEI